jgi:hypothetical protein
LESGFAALLIDGDFFLGSSLANALTKLLLRFSGLAELGSPESNEELAKVGASLLHC